MNKKTKKVTTKVEEKKPETTVDRLKRKITKYQDGIADTAKQLKALTEQMSRLEGAVFALTEELKAEESK